MMQPANSSVNSYYTRNADKLNQLHAELQQDKAADLKKSVRQLHDFIERCFIASYVEYDSLTPAQIRQLLSLLEQVADGGYTALHELYHPALRHIDYGRTVLHSATLFGNYAATAQLATLQPQLVNQAEKSRFQKNTPLHNAAYAGFSDIVRLLLDKGARADTRNGSDRTPLMEVLVNDNVSIEQKLETLHCFNDRGIWLSPADIQSLKTLPNYAERSFSMKAE